MSQFTLLGEEFMLNYMQEYLGSVVLEFAYFCVLTHFFRFKEIQFIFRKRVLYSGMCRLPKFRQKKTSHLHITVKAKALFCALSCVTLPCYGFSLH